MLNIGSNMSPEEFLDSMTLLEKTYLITSMAPFALAPMLAFSDLPRGTVYCIIMVILTLAGVIFRSLFIRWKRMIVLESTLELIIYCDILHSGVITIWG